MLTYYDQIIGRNRIRPRYIWAFWCFWLGLICGIVLAVALA